MEVKMIDATTAQLREFATVGMGLDVPDAATDADIRALIVRAGHKGDSIIVQPAAAEQKRGRKPAAEAPQAEMTGAWAAKQRVTIILHEQDGAPPHEPIGVNGRVILCKRGVPVSVPYPYYRVLKDSLRITYPEASETTGLGPRRYVPTIPFQLVEISPTLLAYDKTLDAKLLASRMASEDA